ncbi:hypothetical protein D3C71_1700740 [compost metagenome]
MALMRSAVTTEIDCGVSRIAVSVLVPVALRLATYPATGLQAVSVLAVTLIGASVVTAVCGMRRKVSAPPGKVTTSRPDPAVTRPSASFNV